jgi:hypothetical protein
LEDAIEEWIKSTSWTQEDDNSDAQRTGLEENQLENQEQQEERKE